MDTVAVLVFLAATLVVLELLRVIQRGVSEHRGHLLLLLATLGMLAWTVQEQLWHSWQALAGGVGTILLVLVPLVIEWLLRKALFRDRLDWAERLAGMKEILTPGRAAAGQHEFLSDLVKARSGRSQEVIHQLRSELAEAEEPAVGHIHERIVTILSVAGRYREAATHYETHLRNEHPALHPAVAVQMVRAYGELGDDERAIVLLQRLEEVSTQDPMAMLAHGQARLHFLAFFATAPLLQQILATPLARKLQPKMRALLAEGAARRAAAPAKAEPTIAERLAQEIGERLLVEVNTVAPTVRSTAPATLALVAVNLIVYLALTRSGRFQDAYDLVRAGVSFHPAVRAGEWWRLWTAMFLHDGSGFMHITLNVLNLYILGRYLEPQLGWIRLLVIYLGAGLTGNLFSLVMGGQGQHTVMSLGASGAIFGLMATLIVTLVIRRGSWPEPWRRSMLINLIVLCLLQLYFGVAVPLIDNWAHAGGGFGGALLALVLVPGGLLGDRRAGRVLAIGLLGVLIGTLTWATGMAARTSAEGTLARLSFRQQRLGPIVLTAPTYSYPYRESAEEMDWPGQETVVDPIAGFGLSPHIMPIEGTTLPAALETCMARDRQAVERRNQPLAESRRLSVEPATPPPMQGWTGAAQALRGPEGEFLYYYGRPLDARRALVVELQFPRKERHHAERVRALERLLASVVIPAENVVPVKLDREDILAWLRETDESRLLDLWRLADETRRTHVGNAVHLRGLVEISNHCSRQCGYCGIRAGNRGIERYRMSADEILDSALLATRLGYGTLVMQSGEDLGIETAWLADVVRRIKAETPLAITLSLGERPHGDLAEWRDAGADRYLLRFETSDPELYRLIHPSHGGRISDRLAILGDLRSLGYEVGSGVMIGIPGQTWSNLADDLLLFRSLDLDMIGVGPYLSHPATPLGQGAWTRPVDSDEQVPATEEMTCRVVALARLLCPSANIPSTTALATLDPELGRERGLQSGANVVMPNVTPLAYRLLYEIYPGKACLTEGAEHCQRCLQGRIHRIGRTVGTGQGGRRQGPTGG